MSNATGWNLLYNGTPVRAAFQLYDTALAGWFIGALFLLFQTILLIKTKNPVAAFITTTIFMSLYIGSQILKPQVGAIMMLLAVIELAGILYWVLFK